MNNDGLNEALNCQSVVPLWSQAGRCLGVSFVEPPLPQRCPSFSASLSVDVSIFPSFRLCLPLLCVIACHVTSFHLRSVLASRRHIIEIEVVVVWI